MPRPNMNTHFVVYNVNGTSQERYSDSASRDAASWLDVWRDETRSSRSTCSALNCSNDAAVGAHVRLADGRSSNAWYIAPFCRSHNHFSVTDSIPLDSRVNLVPVSRSRR